MMASSSRFNKLLSVSSSSSLLKPSRLFFYNSTKGYGEASKDNHNRAVEERAPSTAEEFERVAEEKAKAQQGIASQTVDKTYDGTEEATIGDSKVESVKKRYEEHEAGADYGKRGD